MWIGPRRLGWHPKDLEKKQSEELRESGLHRGMLLGWGVANLSPNPFSSQYPPHLPQGIAFSKGPRWPTLRNFALGALKEFGLGTQTIEERVLEEAACLLGDFQATGGTASILLRFFLLPVGSHSDTDLTPQCTGLGNVPPAFQLRLVAR